MILTPPRTPLLSSTSIPASSQLHSLTPSEKYVDRFVSSQIVRSRAEWYAEIEWASAIFLFGLPLLCLYGAMTTASHSSTVLFSVLYYYVTGMGITVGYHRLWAHKSYNASRPLQWALAFAGAGAVEGSIRWWSRGHRAHHRYVDTCLDPYNAQEGFWHSHMGWMIWKAVTKPPVVDISDLKKNDIVNWQHNNFVPLMLTMAFVVPTVICGHFWGDWRGGFFYAGCIRLLFVHHSTFCVNSLSHWLGEMPFDDKHSPRDHFITALVSIGEGYHNFHHQFPQDYRNAIKWYQYDPSKWFIALAEKVGFASQLRTFPNNEIQKGILTMQLKKAQELSAGITWPKEVNDLPLMSWQNYQRNAKEQHLLLIYGYIHKVDTFMDQHPGGASLIKGLLGKDATTSFGGGQYEHSNAAHNLLANMRVAVLDGGVEIISDSQIDGMLAPPPAFSLDSMTSYCPPSKSLQIISHPDLERLRRRSGSSTLIFG